MSKEKPALKRIDDYRWEVPQTGGMRVRGLIYASEKLLKESGAEGVEQVINVAHLPGIVKYALAMPDMHWGYGFPIGGVAAFDLDTGVVSPGGVGYDINCGCRLMLTALTLADIENRLSQLVVDLFRDIPSGVGSTGEMRLSIEEEKKVLKKGARWAVEQGFGTAEDLEATEDGGVMDFADPERVSQKALERGREQLGTLGSGNHFLEIEVVEQIFDTSVARAFGIEEGQIAIMIHSGSRGLGYQICDDYLATLIKHMNKIGLSVPDRQLACAFIKSPEGQDYLAAMACAANFAWANRQMLMHFTKESLCRSLGISPRTLGMRLLYDVCHNIAKIERFPVGDKELPLCVHRKGATRAFPPGHPQVPNRYRSVGQPVLIPGDMGTGSYVLVGTNRAFEESFGSTCHGAGRVLSRAQATKKSKGRSIEKEMAERGILVMAAGKGTLREEMPEAYKNLDAVVEVVHQAGISQKVARLRTVGCIKG